MANFTCLRPPGRRPAARRVGRGRARDSGRSPGCGCWSAASGTTWSTWRCATSGWLPRAGGASIARDASTRPPCRPRLRDDAPRRRRAPGRQRPTRRASTPSPRRSRGPRARRWVHVDGAFGLFAAASGTRRHLVDGVSSRPTPGPPTRTRPSTSPYDCGLAIVRDRGRAPGLDGHARRLPDPRRGREAVRQGAGDQPARAGLPCGRCCAPSGATASPTSSTGSATSAGALRQGIDDIEGRRGPQRRRSSPRCAPRSATTSGRGRWCRRCSDDGTAWMIGLALARPCRAPGVGQQLVDDRGRRGRSLAALRAPPADRLAACVSPDSPPEKSPCTAS